jgi:hypothetical protein
MRKVAWIEFSARERAILVDALSMLRGVGGANRSAIDAITAKLVHSRPFPRITVGVRSGQVQWTTGNPFPIWVCDYDGEESDLPDIDERGQRCRIWFEPARGSRAPFE